METYSLVHMQFVSFNLNIKLCIFYNPTGFRDNKSLEHEGEKIFISNYYSVKIFIPKSIDL